MLPCSRPMRILPFTLLSAIDVPPLPSLPVRFLPTYPPCTSRGKSDRMPPLTVPGISVLAPNSPILYPPRGSREHYFFFGWAQGSAPGSRLPQRESPNC